MIQDPAFEYGIHQFRWSFSASSEVRPMLNETAVSGIDCLSSLVLNGEVLQLLLLFFFHPILIKI